MESNKRSRFPGKFEFSHQNSGLIGACSTALLFGASLYVLKPRRVEFKQSSCGSGWVIGSYRSALSFRTDNTWPACL